MTFCRMLMFQNLTERIVRRLRVRCWISCYFSRVSIHKLFRETFPRGKSRAQVMKVADTNGDKSGAGLK